VKRTDVPSRRSDASYWKIVSEANLCPFLVGTYFYFEYLVCIIAYFHISQNVPLCVILTLFLSILLASWNVSVHQRQDFIRCQFLRQLMVHKLRTATVGKPKCTYIYLYLNIVQQSTYRFLHDHRYVPVPTE